MDMTPEQFRLRLRALGLSLSGFCALAGVSRSTATCWGSGRSGRGVQAFPEWVGRLLDAWEALGRVPEQSAPR